jgi:hypothetical protein
VRYANPILFVVHVLHLDEPPNAPLGSLSGITCFPLPPGAAGPDRHASFLADFRGFCAVAFLFCLLMLQK